MAYQQPRLPPSKDDYAYRVRDRLDKAIDIEEGELKLRRALSHKSFFKPFLAGTNYYEFEKKIISLPNSAFSKAQALLEKQADLAREAGIFGEEDVYAILDKEDESDNLEPEQGDKD